MDSGAAGKRVPPLLLGAGLLFWGWQTAQLTPALAMALALEAPRRLPWRWQLQDRDFNRVADLSALIFAIGVVYAFNAYALHGIYMILQWLPMLLFLLILSQVYSERGAVNLSALFVSLRRETLPRDRLMDMGLPYLMVCLVAASAGNQGGPAYLAGAGLLLAWALWARRPRRYRAWLWAVLLACALGLGLAGQGGIRQVQRAVEGTVAGWLDSLLWRNRDPGRMVTAIGSLGQLKLSERIRVRVRPEGEVRAPLLLREASYTVFSSGTWLSQGAEFVPVDPEDGGRLWRLRDYRGPGDSLRISTYLRRDAGVVPMPLGAYAIEEDGLVDVQRNRLGTVQLERKAGLVNYRVRFQPGDSGDAPPGPQDTEVPPAYRPGLAALLEEIDRDPQAPAQVLERIGAFFSDNFEYSLVRPGRYPGATPLMTFLEKTRHGHCEYFATATVLLLRQAGIPARYAVGYSVQEYSPLERLWIARDRHSHAWALAHVDGRWQVLDTTPAIWRSLEDEAAPAWQGLFDLGATLRHWLAGWRYRDAGDWDMGWLLWLLPVLLVVLVWRLRARRRVRRHPPDLERRPAAAGADSEFFLLVNAAERRGHRLRPADSLGAWLRRAAQRLPPDTAWALERLLALHQRLRFDPRGLTPTQRRDLRQSVQALLRSDPVLARRSRK